MKPPPPPPPLPPRPPALRTVPTPTPIPDVRNTSTQTEPLEEEEEEAEEINQEMEQQEQIVQDEETETETTTQWSRLLTVESLNGNVNGNNETVQILIGSDTSQKELAHCIAHAALSPSGAIELLRSWRVDDADDSNDVNVSRIAGLFRESDGVFLPLSVLLNCSFSISDNDVFRISRSSSSTAANFNTNKSHLDSSPAGQMQYLGFYKREIVVYSFMAIYSGYKLMIGDNLLEKYDQYQYHYMEKLQQIISYLAALPLNIVDTFINYPLEQVYRYGPPLIGWEGQPLSLICSQITHMGDSSFWARNMDECDKIYNTKLNASMHFRKPLVFLCLAYIIFLGIRSIVKARAVREQNRPSQEMVEVYDAFKILIKVLKRGMNVNSNANANSNVNNHRAAR